MTTQPPAPRCLGVTNADDTDQRFRLLLAIADSMGSPCELHTLLDRLGDLLNQLLIF